MHNLKLILGAAAVGAMTTVATAELVTVPDFEIIGHIIGDPSDDPLVTFNLTAADGLYNSMIITFDFVEPEPDATWASDLVTQMTFDAGYIVDLRGSFPGSGSALDVLNADEGGIWDFDGSQSADDGTYSSAYTFVSPVTVSGGGFDIAFSDIWDGEYLISNMTIELLPAPGVLALLGLAGLATRRRRR